MRTIVFMNLSILAAEVVHPRILGHAETGIYDDCSRGSMAYGTVGDAVMAFIMTTVAGDSWEQTSIPLMTHHPWTAFILIPTFVMDQLGLMRRPFERWHRHCEFFYVF